MKFEVLVLVFLLGNKTCLASSVDLENLRSEMDVSDLVVLTSHLALESTVCYF